MAKDILKQLHRENHRLRAENERLGAENQQLRSENQQLRQQVVELTEQVKRLTEQVAQLSKDSSTSSRPPSSDIVKPPRPPSPAGPRRQGGHRRFLGPVGALGVLVLFVVGSVILGLTGRLVERRISIPAIHKALCAGGYSVCVACGRLFPAEDRRDSCSCGGTVLPWSGKGTRGIGSGKAPG